MKFFDSGPKRIKRNYDIGSWTIIPCEWEGTCACYVWSTSKVHCKFILKIGHSKCLFLKNIFCRYENCYIAARMIRYIIQGWKL